MKIYSAKQARWAGAVIGGAIRNPKGLSDATLKNVLRGKKISSFGGKGKGGKKK